MPPQEKFGKGGGGSEEPSPEELCPSNVSVVVSQALDPTAEDDATTMAVAKKKKRSKEVRSKEEKAKDVDFDDLLPHIGEFGTYQKILFILMIPFAFYVAWVYFSQIFITLVPEEHWCLVPELMGLPVERRLVFFFFFFI